MKVQFLVYSSRALHISLSSSEFPTIDGSVVKKFYTGVLENFFYVFVELDRKVTPPNTLFHKDVEFNFLSTGSVKAFYSLKDKVAGDVTVMEEAPRYRTPVWVANFPFEDLTDLFDEPPTPGINKYFINIIL
jgi:hypothetical protein